MTDEEKIKEIREAVLKFYDDHPEVGIVAHELVCHDELGCCGMGAWVTEREFGGSIYVARSYDRTNQGVCSLNSIVAYKFGGEFCTRFEGGFDHAVGEHHRGTVDAWEREHVVVTAPAKAGAALARELIAKGVKVYY